MRAIRAALAVTALQFGCASWVPYGGATHTAVPSMSADRLYAATIRVFVRHGWGIQPHDASAHVVETARFRWGGAWTGEALISYRVFTRNDDVEIFTSCTRDLDECPAGQRPEGVVESEQELVREIRAEASTL